MPITSMEPWVGLSSPATRRSSEDFPLPDGPTTTETPPRGNVDVTSRSAPLTSPVGVR